MRLIDIAFETNDDEAPLAAGTVLGNHFQPVALSGQRYQHFEVFQLTDGSLWELGRGAMGITYKAFDTNLHCPVALKIINSALTDDSNARERFLREARAAARLRHPNVATVLHLGQDGNGCFYAMEFIEGETLEAFVARKGPLPGSLALEITAQIARALGAAQSEGLVHRDIKPANIMLARHEGEGEEEGVHVKVIDFGLAKFMAGNAIAEHPLWIGKYFAGTPHFASPEQLAGSAVDARSDIYSMGATLGYMLSGEVLSRDLPTAFRTGSQSPQLSPSGLPEEMSKDVVSLLKSLLEIDPALRPQTAIKALEMCSQCQLSLVQAAVPKARRRSNAFDARFFILSALFLMTAAAASFVGLRARNMIPVLKAKTPFDMKPSQETEAYMAYAQGRAHALKLTKEDNARAIELYVRALELDSKIPRIHAALAEAYCQNFLRFSFAVDQLDLAAASARRAISLEPSAPEGYSALGLVYSAQGKQRKALAETRRALEADVKYGPAMRIFGKLWVMEGQPHKGLPWLKAATQLEPSVAVGWHMVAEAYVDLCADDEAQKAYEKCLQIDPGFMPARYALAHLHLLQKQFARARQECAEAMIFRPNYTMCLLVSAQANFFSGDYAQAETDYWQLAADNRAGNVAAYGGIRYLSALGYLRGAAGDSVAGASLLEESAALGETHLSDGPQAVYDLAATRSAQGRKEEALALLRQAAETGWLDYRSTLLDPRFSAIKDEPAFETIIQSIGEAVTDMKGQAERMQSKALDIADYPAPDA